MQTPILNSYFYETEKAYPNWHSCILGQLLQKWLKIDTYGAKPASQKKGLSMFPVLAMLYFPFFLA